MINRVIIIDAMMSDDVVNFKDQMKTHKVEHPEGENIKTRLSPDYKPENHECGPKIFKGFISGCFRVAVADVIPSSTSFHVGLNLFYSFRQTM